MKKIHTPQTLFLLLALLFLGCAPQQKNDLTVRLEVTSPRVGKTRLEFDLQYQNKPLEKATVVVRGDMTHAGMAPVEQIAREMGGGKYLLESFSFTMAGDWVLTVTAKSNDKTLLGEVKLGVNP